MFCFSFGFFGFLNFSGLDCFFDWFLFFKFGILENVCVIGWCILLFCVYRFCAFSRKKMDKVFVFMEVKKEGRSNK